MNRRQRRAEDRLYRIVPRPRVDCLNIEEAVAAIEMMDGDPGIREALINLVTQGKVVAGIRADGQLCFQAIPTHH